MKPRAIFKSYPVYHPSKAPAGYWDWLRQQEPKEIFDPLLFASREDWLGAGEIVFDAATAYNGPILPEETLTSDWYQKTGMPLTRDGVMPFYRYVVRTKGKVELGTNSCATCQTRILADGSVLKGTQGNFPFDRRTYLLKRTVLQRTGEPYVFGGFLRCEKVLHCHIEWRDIRNVGYARVSTDDQDTAAQVTALKTVGCGRIFREKASGGRWDRPEPHRLLDQLRKGDALVVWKLDRLSHSLRDVLTIMERLVWGKPRPDFEV